MFRRPRLLPLNSTRSAFIFFTSGSTGKPKGVTLTHDTCGWMIASASSGLALTPGEVFMPATSASHVAASSLAFAALAAGASVAIARSFGGDGNCSRCSARRAPRCCACCRRRCSASCAIVARRGTILQSIRRCVSGGDKISEELEREFIGLAGFAIEELYGMTETGTSAINPTAAGIGLVRSAN